MHDLLIDELIGVRSPGGERHVSLPMLLALLAQGAVDDYTGLRPHQADPWHVILVQLAASIQARRPTDAMPTEPAYWREGLLDLADGQATAWSLVVDDVTKPAFLQHPWKSWEAEATDYGVKTARGKTTYAPKASAPDELDVLVTSKNHDVKMSRIDERDAQSWLYALLLYQTTSGFLGAGNYGVIRMNGGFGSRPIVSWASDPHPSRRFVSEARVLRTLRETIIPAYGYRTRGTALTWLTHWNRDGHQHVLQDLEPWFIEAARPVRLHRTDENRIVALGATSKARQIGPRNVENGDVGDPWIPLNTQDKKKERSALTLPAAGFTPDRLSDLLFKQGFELTALQRPPEGNGLGWFLASVLVRGQGTTEGFHRVELPVPAKARMALFSAASRDTLAHVAQDLLSDSAGVTAALRMALTVLAEGGPESADFDRDAVKRWVDGTRTAFTKRWEARYFPTLWRAAEEDREAVRQAWQYELVDVARELLDHANMRLPLPSNRYWRAVTQAHGAFAGMLRKKGLTLRPPLQAESFDTNEESTP